YTHPAYFSGPQPHQLMAIPPLAPSHSNSAADDFHNATRPLGMLDQFSNDDSFQHFDDNYTQPYPLIDPLIDPLLLAGQPHPASNIVPLTQSEAEVQAQSHRQGSNSNPAQSRQKAQNHAAQAAYYERRIRHVKEIEDRLRHRENEHRLAAIENERLLRDLQKLRAENEILRATSSIGGNPSYPGINADPTITGPMSSKQVYADAAKKEAKKKSSHRIGLSDGAQSLIAYGAMKELVVSAELYKRGLVDIHDFKANLKIQTNMARRDPNGPDVLGKMVLDEIKAAVAK
ncbi:hypothetical protein B0T17DRAFT_455354, partial [Bombardia bombarda]